MRHRIHAAILTLALLLSWGSGAAAQDVQGPNARLRLDGQTASVVDPVGHGIPFEVPGTWQIEIDSGANTEQAFILLAKPECPGDPACFVPGAINTPWGGSVDMTVAGAVLVLDGITFSVNPFLDAFARTDSSGLFSVSPFAGSFLADKRFCLQAIVSDPTNPVGGFGLDNTELGSIVFMDPPQIVTTCIPGLPDDGFQSHALTAVPSISFFGGFLSPQTYTSLFINSNGFISFDAGSTDFSETLGEFFGGIGSPSNPAVALYYSDLNRGGTGSGASYKIIEDPNAQTVEVIYENQNHWSSQDPAGDFSVRFNLASHAITFDYSAFIPAISATDDGIFGVTDGDSSAGTDTDLSNNMGTGTSIAATAPAMYVSPNAGNSIGELIPGNTAIGSQIYEFTDTGTPLFPGSWVIIAY